MTSSSAIINLIREKQTFHACITIIQGVFPELVLHLDRLHPNEKGIYHQYEYDQRKKSYLLGRLSAKQAILNLTETNTPTSVWIDSGVFQFPVVKCPGIHNIQVSISHCEDIGLSIAFPETHPMGIDLERVTIDRTDVVLSQITDSEKSLLRQAGLDNIGGYTNIFSMKEALSKVIKTGMMLDFKFLEVDSIQTENNVLECTFSHFGQYQAFSGIKGNYAVAIALPKRTKVDLEHVWRMFDSMKIL